MRKKNRCRHRGYRLWYAAVFNGQLDAADKFSQIRLMAVDLMAKAENIAMRIA